MYSHCVQLMMFSQIIINEMTFFASEKYTDFVYCVKNKGAILHLRSYYELQGPSFAFLLIVRINVVVHQLTFHKI